MSKYVKDLLTDEIGKRLDGVQDLLLVNISGMTANDNSALRVALRKKNIRMTMVKNSLARKAIDGTGRRCADERQQNHPASQLCATRHGASGIDQ